MAVIDLATRTVTGSIRVGRLPFALALSPDGSRLYVTNIGMFEYKVLEGEPVQFPLFGFPSRESRAALGDPNVREANSLGVLGHHGSTAQTGHPDPDRPALRPAESWEEAVLQALSQRPIVFMFPTATMTRSRSSMRGRFAAQRDIPLRIPGLESFRGILPIGLALQGENLLVAEAGINAIGIIANGQLKGHIPAGWFPTKVAVHGTQSGQRARKVMEPGRIRV